MKQELKIKRGDILSVNLGISVGGSIQSGIRPAVVVSNNKANAHSPVITVVPLSSKTHKKTDLPTHVFLSVCNAKGLEQDSIALCEQVTALDVRCAIAKIGYVDMDTLGLLTTALQVQIGVFSKYN